MTQPVIYSETEKEILFPARDLIAKAGLEGDFSLIRLAGGKNNRVFQLKGKGRSYLLKSYFRHEHDPRDRLGTEYAFVSFVWNCGIQTVPKPVASDQVHGLGLYEFVEGRKLCPDEIREDHVKQAIRFYIDLNEKKDCSEAHQLPIASEACFSIHDHLDCVEGRLRRLKAIEIADEVTERAGHFIENRLVPAWAKIRDEVFRKTGKPGLHPDQSISAEERCLSPSDFGFHNALLEKGGQLRFIDFEYAGWDDPAKMVCDFFCQPAVPVAPGFFSLFEAEVLKHSLNSEALRQRFRLLFPVYQMKWCCIMLNDFLAVGDKRRGFAWHTAHEDRKKIQLGKAQVYFQEFCRTGQF